MYIGSGVTEYYTPSVQTTKNQTEDLVKQDYLDYINNYLSDKITSAECSNHERGLIPEIHIPSRQKVPI